MDTEGRGCSDGTVYREGKKYFRVSCEGNIQYVPEMFRDFVCIIFSADSIFS